MGPVVQDIREHEQISDESASCVVSKSRDSNDIDDLSRKIGRVMGAWQILDKGVQFETFSAHLMSRVPNMLLTLQIETRW